MHVLLGVAAAALSSATQSLGLTLQRKAHMKDELDPQSHSWVLWRVGLALFIFSNVFGSGVQLVTLPLIILCPLQAIGLVFNSAWAAIILGEPLTMLSCAGTVLVVVGAAMIAGLGAMKQPGSDCGDIVEHLTQTRFELWMLLTVAFMAVFFLVALRTRASQIKGLCMGGIAGVCSGHSLLMAKNVVDLIVRSVHGRKSYFKLLRPDFWLVFVLFLFFAFSQLYFANAGLKYCSTSVIYPLVFCIYNIVSMTNSLLFFCKQEVNGYQIFWVTLGTGILLSGVLLLSVRLSQSTCDNRAPDVRTSLLSEANYTSLDTLNPNITNPDSPASHKNRWRNGHRGFSKERAQILSELAGP